MNDALLGQPHKYKALPIELKVRPRNSQVNITDLQQLDDKVHTHKIWRKIVSINYRGTTAMQSEATRSERRPKRKTTWHMDISQVSGYWAWASWRPVRFVSDRVVSVICKSRRRTWSTNSIASSRLIDLIELTFWLLNNTP